MELQNGWTIIYEVDGLTIKILKNINNDKEFVIRDINDTGAFASLIISNLDTEVQVIS